MEDTTISIIGIIIASILMFIVPFVLLADRNDDIAQLTVQTVTADFVDNGIKTGKITVRILEKVTPELREDLVSHFIRGYFDADGSVWFPTRQRSRNNKRIEFGGATKNFLLKLKEVLDKNDIHDRALRIYAMATFATMGLNKEEDLIDNKLEELDKKYNPLPPGKESL